MLALTVQGKVEYLAEEEKDAAMLRYWNARQSGDATAALRRVEEIAEPAPPTAAGQVSEVAQLRVAQQERWLKDSGFAPAPPLFAAGTRVLPLGDENFRVERKRVEALPRFRDAADLVSAQIRTEDREDVSARSSRIAMDEEGRLVVDGVAMAMEPGSFLQLANLVGFGVGGRYLANHCPAPLRAENVNRQLGLLRERDLVLRTRRAASGSRQVFAAVTPTYSAVDTDEVLGTITEWLTDARAEVRYDGSGIRATGLWMPDTVIDLAAGDVFKAGVQLRTDDVGRGRIRLSGVAWRNLCLNLIVIDVGEVETVALVHRGDRERIVSQVRDGVEQARATVANFLGAWGFARTVKVDAAERIRKLVEEQKLSPRGAKERDAVVDALLGAWQVEPGDSVADVANALTRAAHEQPDWPLDFREELERQAARLVYVPR